MRELPSAMFDEIETAARRIWFVSPKRSSAGKPRVCLYTKSAKSIAFCQTSNFSKLNILNSVAINNQLSTTNYL